MKSWCRTGQYTASVTALSSRQMKMVWRKPFLRSIKVAFCSSPNARATIRYKWSSEEPRLEARLSVQDFRAGQRGLVVHFPNLFQCFLGSSPNVRRLVFEAGSKGRQGGLRFPVNGNEGFHCSQSDFRVSVLESSAQGAERRVVICAEDAEGFECQFSRGRVFGLRQLPEAGRRQPQRPVVLDRAFVAAFWTVWSPWLIRLTSAQTFGVPISDKLVEA